MQQKINAKLEFLLAKGTNPDGLLYEAAHYLLLAPGKRIRPLLTCAIAEMLQGNREAALTAGCAIEIIHTYSLIHDDLPCMDDDDMRRGKPSMHKAYDEATAILVGDFLLTYAFEVLVSHVDVGDHQKVQLVATLAQASGGKGMVMGQLLDLQAIDTTLIHSLKTAALFKAAFAFGAILSDVNATLLHQIKELGHEFGLLFQLVDDIHDQDHPEGHQKAIEKTKKKKVYLLEQLRSLPYNSAPIESLLNLCEL